MQRSFSIYIMTLVMMILIQQISAYTCNKYVYNSTLLVLDWPSEFCYHHQTCKQNWRQIAGGDRLIIQGYWPASENIDYLNCIQYMGHDPNCYIAHLYNEGELNNSLLGELGTFWPQITVSNDIKSDSWAEHGTCYLSVVQTLNPLSIGSENRVFQTYFKSTVLKAKRLNLKITTKQFKNKNDLAASLGIKSEQFHAICNYDDDYLSQIRVCYDFNGLAGTQSISNCIGQQPNQCEFPVKVRTSSAFYLQQLLTLLLVIFAFVY